MSFSFGCLFSFIRKKKKRQKHLASISHSQGWLTSVEGVPDGRFIRVRVGLPVISNNGYLMSVISFFCLTKETANSWVGWPEGRRGAASRHWLFAPIKRHDPSAELLRADDLAAATFLSADWNWNLNDECCPWAMCLWEMLPLKSEGIIQKCKPNSAFPSVYINQYISNGMWLSEKECVSLLESVPPDDMDSHGSVSHFSVLFHLWDENTYIQQEKRIRSFQCGK